jgi:toxin-antitoxin system PIN domain toxin
MLAVDTNVLVYAHRRETREHVVAQSLLRELAEGPRLWAIPWPCVYEFLSVVTNPRIWKDVASAPNQAWSQLDAWLSSPTLQLLSEPEDFCKILGDFLTRPRVRGPIVHDARVAAICVAHAVDPLLTRDRDFELFPELKRKNPFATLC